MSDFSIAPVNAANSDCCFFLISNVLASYTASSITALVKARPGVQFVVKFYC